MPQYRKDGVTRRLCASVHLDDEFAQVVDGELTGDRLDAIGLTLGVNFVALARHARVAVRRRAALDRQLAGLCAASAVSLAVGLWGLASGHGSVAQVGIYGPLGVLAAAWLLVHHAQSRARAAAHEVFRTSPEKSENLAPPVEPEAEAWLHDLKRANVLPYADEAAREKPFVGSGTVLRKVAVWQPIDVSKPAEAPGGGKLTMRPFDAVDLHTYVARQMESIAGLDGLRARNRLYVLGSHAYLLPDLVPDRTRRPRAQIPKQLVQAGLQNPGAAMRTHLCLERIGEGGRIIVSMYLRAILNRPSLTWEVATYAIPPLGARFYRVNQLPLAPFDHWWSLVRYATSHTWPELRGAPGRIRGRGRWQRKRTKYLKKWRRDITNQHLVYDYGAPDSLRERISDWEQAGHNERSDAADFLNRLQQGVLTATERFLEDHHVDTSSFDKAQQIINTQTYNINNVNGPSNIGNNNQINHPNAPQGNGPSGPGGGTPPKP
ncbi:aromatic ring-opening dioxygenase LigA [Streptomyces dysideae]|uniref:Aromatic ring-opening dioxygenase LigA n=1 Tax=Streptomyces dysideae TaxID=909626 RepID=A0A101UYA4_9ACTN|nr:aromatic ring-opening dioxygenase LigA [Streptomyces dysideae]